MLLHILFDMMSAVFWEKSFRYVASAVPYISL